MIIYGKLEATFTGRKTPNSIQNSKKHKINHGDSFQIAELNNIIESEVREISIAENLNIERLNAKYRLIGNASINRSTLNVKTTDNSTEFHDLDWNKIELFNSRIINIHKVSRGYYIKALKNASLLDGLVAMVANIFIYPTSLFFGSLIPLTDEIFVGHIESEFIGNSIPLDSSINELSESDLETNVNNADVENTETDLEKTDNIEPNVIS
jgi:hypothetical protein